MHFEDSTTKKRQEGELEKKITSNLKYTSSNVIFININKEKTKKTFLTRIFSPARPLAFFSTLLLFIDHDTTTTRRGGATPEIYTKYKEIRSAAVQQSSSRIVIVIIYILLLLLLSINTNTNTRNTK
jgi:hypothetical protein